MHRNLKSPRARRKVFQYVAKRQKTESGTEKKAIVKELTTLKTDGGILEGGDQEDTYSHKMLQKVKKKQQKKEDKAAKEIAQTTKKWLGIQKMKETKAAKKKQKETEQAMAKAAASSASCSEAAVPAAVSAAVPG